MPTSAHLSALLTVYDSLMFGISVFLLMKDDKVMPFLLHTLIANC